VVYLIAFIFSGGPAPCDCDTWVQIYGYPDAPPDCDHGVRWTVLIFMNGDNNLEFAAIEDLNEMEEVGSSLNVNIIAQVDRIDGFDVSNGDWTDTRRYRIIHDNDPQIVNSIRLDAANPLGELNMGNPDVLVDFVEWGITQYPANYYAVIVWNHGDGWYKIGDGNTILSKGMSSDWTDDDELGVSNGEWLDAISEIRTYLGRDIHLVGFDACLMQMWEVMDITDSYAGYMVASEENENLDGWDYEWFLDELVANYAMSAYHLGRHIVDAAVEGDNQETQSCVRLSKILPLNSAIDDFALRLINAYGTHEIAIDDIRNSMNTFGPLWIEHIDLYTFAEAVSGSDDLPMDLRTSAVSVMNAVNSAVTYNRTQPGWEWAHGVAIYYPVNGYDADYDLLPIAGSTHWDDFIRDYVN
jgi:hypothetical protein